MLIDARDLQQGHELHADVCIIGGGPAGITLLKELTNSALDVVLLESGGLEETKAAQSLGAGRNIGLPYYPLHRARGRYFGGSSNFWFSDVGLRSRPLDPWDFERRPWIPFSGWPFSKSEIETHYEAAQSMLGLGPYNYDADYWEKQLRLTSLPFDACEIGTTIFQFGPTDKMRSYLAEFEASQRARLVLNANVLEIQTFRTAVTSLKVGTLAGKSFTASARAYVLAAGGIENARLLLLSRAEQKNGLGNQNDLVGRFFMEHPHMASGHILPVREELVDRVEIYLGRSALGTKVMGALATSFTVQEREQVGNFTAFLHTTDPASATTKGVRSLRDVWHAARQGRWNARAVNQLSSHARNIATEIHHIAALASRRILARKRKSSMLVEFTVMSEQVPNPESRVTLSTERDLFGLNRAQLNWQLANQDIETIVASQRVLDAELQRWGVGKLGAAFEDESPRPFISGGWHHMGTTRMNNDPKQGVVDEDCKVHGLANLFVGGSSVFPTSGYANPTLTIVALAIRLAEHVHQFLSATELL